MSRVQNKVSFREAVTTAWTSFESPPAAPSQPAGQFQRLQKPVLAFGCFVALLVLFAAYFTDRNGDMDELTFFNPSYMISHFGKWTYPGYAHRAFFDEPVITHPPLHVGLIGLLGRLGFTYYYAEATPTVFFFLLAILVILRGAFPPPVKLGLLFSIGFLMLTGETFAVSFGTRPEGELQAVWLAGLLLLESGRLDNWYHPKLFAGAFLLTWASGLHYYAGAAFLGVLVYIVWALSSLGWKSGWSRALALCAGGCLFGIPYATFYLVPYFKKIWSAIQANQGDRGFLVAVRTHLNWYRTWAHLEYIPALVRKPFGLGVPLLVFSTTALSLVRSTRGLALAALPLQLFIFALASHKLSGYFVHEVGLFAAAVGVGSLVLAERLWRRIPVARIQPLFLPVAAVLLALYLVVGNPALRAVIVSEEPHIHEADLARASARVILGPQARVAGRLGAWYSSGAAFWWDIESDMLGTDPFNPTTYFSNFDAVAEYAHMSETTGNASISSWYASGALKLRGFYFGETNEQLQIVLLSATPPPQVIGYAARNHELYRFEEHPDGDYQVLSAVCPMTPELREDRWWNRWDGTFSSLLRLPQRNGDPAGFVVTVLAPRLLAEPAGWMGRSCRGIGKIRGTLLPADRKALVDSLRRGDTPIVFNRNMEELPGYTSQGLTQSMTPPAGTIRLNQVLALSGIQPATEKVRIERIPQLRISTSLSGGAFAASIPVTHRESVPASCWVQLRLKVILGWIGFAAYNPRQGILARTPFPLLKSNQPLDVAVAIPDLHAATDIIIFNEGNTPGKVDVLDATVLVAPQIWDLNKAAFSAIR
jgi:hypothetical protein